MKALSLDKISLLLGSTSLVILIVIENYFSILTQDGLDKSIHSALLWITGLCYVTGFSAFLANKQKRALYNTFTLNLGLTLALPTIFYLIFFNVYQHMI